MLNLEDVDIGIGPLTCCLPAERRPLDSGQEFSPAPFSFQRALQYWPERIIEPEKTFRFMASQSADAERLSPRLQSIAKQSGLGSFTVSHQTSCDLALDAARQLLARHDRAISPQAIIYCSSTLSTRTAWSTPCRLQHELGLKNCTAFAINQKGENSLFAGLRVACEMLLIEAAIQEVLLVASDRFVPPYRRQYSNLFFAGDGASAMVVRRKACSWRILALEYRDPCSRVDLSSLDPHDLTDLFASNLSALIRQVLETNGAKVSEVARVIPPNWSLTLLLAIARQLGLPAERIFCRGVHELGSLATSDLPANLDLAQASGQFRPGDLVLCLGLSRNLSMTCGLLRYLCRGSDE